jgi:hypothetical protein
MGFRFRKRKKRASAEDLIYSEAIQDEFASLARILGSDPAELDGEEAEFRRAMDAYAEASDKVVAEYVERLKEAGVSPDDAFTLVRSETKDGGVAARVRENLWIANLTDLGDDDFIALADKTEAGPPNKTRFRGLDAERKRRGLRPVPPLDIPVGAEDPSATVDRMKQDSVSDPTVIEWVERLRAEGRSYEETFPVVLDETDDVAFAISVSEEFWASQLRELDDEAFLAVAAEVKRDPMLSKLQAVGRERARRDPSWAAKQARHMRASNRFWELNSLAASGLASEAQMIEQQRVEIELDRALADLDEEP